MSAPKKCTRCDAVVPSILSGPPDERDMWWRNVIGMRRIEVAYRMRLRMFRRRWLPENPHDQLRETYTELDLCDPCARAVFAFAQARPVADTPTESPASTEGATE